MNIENRTQTAVKKSLGGKGVLLICFCHFPFSELRGSSVFTWVLTGTGIFNDFHTGDGIVAHWKAHTYSAASSGVSSKLSTKQCQCWQS